MNTKPLYNALFAITYIVLIVLSMNFITQTEIDEGIASIIMPIILLSLLTLSVAVMGYLFCLQPLRLYLDGNKQEGVSLFIKTIIIFASITFGISIIYFLQQLSLSKETRHSQVIIYN